MRDVVLGNACRPRQTLKFLLQATNDRQMCQVTPAVSAGLVVQPSQQVIPMRIFLRDREQNFNDNCVRVPRK